MVRSKALWLRMFSNLKQLSSNSRGGIGHRDAEYLNMSYVDPYSLTEIGEELNEFERNEVWKLVPIPKNRSIVGTKWIFKNKTDSDGVIIRNKARLVAKGLDKALYGLKQAPRAWYETLALFLLESGFKRGAIDKTLFYLNHGKDLLLVQIYVDDIIFGSTNNKLCEKFSKLMQSRYQMCMMGEMSYFLGLQVKQTDKGIFINQSKYTRNLLTRFNMQDSTPASTPIATATKLDPDQGAEFESNGVTHLVTPAVIEEALHLPILGDNVPSVISGSALFEFVKKLGYNGDVKRYGNLFRTKLKKEWNFFFDTISRCFLNNTSNFDALSSGSLKIGITENNIKSLVNSNKANGFIGNAFIPDEVRFFLHRKMPTRYGLISNAMGQGSTHLVPDTSIHPKQSKQLTTSSIVSQKTLVVKAKKSSRTDVSGRQSGSKDFSSTPLTKKKLKGGVQGVLVKKAAKGGEVVSVQRKLVLRDETDSEDDLPISSVMNVNKEVADTATKAVVPSSLPQKKRKLSKSRYHIPLTVQMKDTDIQTSTPDESSTPDALANTDVSIPDATTKVVSISDSPASPSNFREISWEKVSKIASLVGLTPNSKKQRNAEELVYQRQKKLKGSSPQEPEFQSNSAATVDPATQEPLNQSLATQEPSSQSEDAGKATASVERLVENIVYEGSTQEPLAQSVEAASEPQTTQEPLVENTDASISHPDGVHPDASGAPDIEPILIQPLHSRPMDHPISESQDKQKGIAIPDPDVTHSTDDEDSADSDDDENRKEKEQLATALKISLGTNFGSSNRMNGTIHGTILMNLSVFSSAIEHVYQAVKSIENQDFTKVPTAFQLRVVESQVKSVVSEQTSINQRIDSLDTKVTDIQASLSLILNLLSNSDVKKGEKVSRTKCTPDLVLRNNDDDTGDDGSDKVIQGETSDAAVLKSTIQTSQSQTMQSTHVSNSGVKTKFSTKDGRIVTLYHTDKRVQQLFARKAISTVSEEYPDLSHEEFLRLQRETMESYTAPARGRGDRGRRGARRSRRGSSTQTVPRQTRSTGLRIEEIPEPTQTLVVPDRSTFGDDGNIEEEPELRRKSTLCNTNQIEESNPDVVPDNIQDPDDSEILQEVDLIILSTVVDSHNKEVDEEEEARRREITRRTSRDFNLYLQRLKLSNERKWRNPRRQESSLERSYAFEKEKDKKWKHISTLRCDTPINFQYGGIITSASSVVDLSDMVRSKALWLRMFSNLKQLSSNSRGGIGHRDAEYLNMSYVDPYSLTEIRGTLTSKNLNNLIAVDIVIDCHDGFDKKEKLLYFMKDGSVKILSIQDLLMKTTQELKYVHYLLRSKNQICKEWSDMILSTIRRRLDGNSNCNGNYIPMYLNQRGQDVEMQRGTAVKEVNFGMTHLSLNPDGKEIAYLMLEEHSLQRNSILNLRAAIYQINEEDEELRNLKERLIQILEEKEENLLSNFLKMNLFYQRV
ncbi:hypothetical protein POM88_002019 [Heracleum sosnowskyi]|uniref:Reverse transcriptase Ty1/copia-type domain-containing protein n=1 Tax=Heracleum sosnowskyi TaxID=360622 RepID=A0AAD8JE14_9APIA|nr:hypothetical protein POM88_002019 [Heracleum sosnowskyi]